MQAKLSTARNPLKIPPIPGIGNHTGGQKLGVTPLPEQLPNNQSSPNTTQFWKPSPIIQTAMMNNRPSIAFVQSLFQNKQPTQNPAASPFAAQLGQQAATQKI